MKIFSVFKHKKKSIIGNVLRTGRNQHEMIHYDKANCLIHFPWALWSNNVIIMSGCVYN